MMARSPVGASWQKTTRSCPERSDDPLSLCDVANSFVTVVTLPVRPQILVDPGAESSVCPCARSRVTGGGTADPLQGRRSRPLGRPRGGLGKFFRFGHDATVRIARITQRDTHQPYNRASRDEKLAPGGRRVTGRDGNMVSV